MWNLLITSHKITTLYDLLKRLRESETFEAVWYCHVYGVTVDVFRLGLWCLTPL